MIEFLYEQTDVSKKDVSTVVNTFLSTILEKVKQGEKITLRGFGTFYLLEKKERQVYSPIAQKNVDVSARLNVMFKSGTEAKIIKNQGD
jgi:DNA-binding protein HU-beta